MRQYELLAADVDVMNCVQSALNNFSEISDLILRDLCE